VSRRPSAFGVCRGFPFGLASFLDFGDDEPWVTPTTEGLMMDSVLYEWDRGASKCSNKCASRPLIQTFF
jgi:hypothetical protein